MQFTKNYVPDKRWQTGLRPIIVKTNFIFFILWKLFYFFENIFSFLRQSIESSFKEVEQKIEEEKK